MPETKYERIQQDAQNQQQLDDIDIENETNIEITKTTSVFSLIQTCVFTIALILFYFMLSILLTFYQQDLLQDLHFPFSVVFYHLFTKLVLSIILRIIYKCATGKSRILLSFQSCVKKVAPCGIASGLDIGFSNWGLELVNISIYTMTKSSTIIFILVFATILGLEKKSWSLVMIVVMISGGLSMFTYKSTQFNALGFSFLLFASLASGIRWTFAQLVMQKSKLGLHNPIDMVFHMQPWMMVAIIPLTIGFEGKKLIEGIWLLQDVKTSEILYFWMRLSLGAIIAFAMEISEFLVLSYTSSLTLSVAGIFKEICQLILAVKLKGDQLSTINGLGLAMCIGGISCHVLHKFLNYVPNIQETTNGNIFYLKKPLNNIYNTNNTKENNTIKHSNQNIPLLNNIIDDSDNENMNTDSDNSQNNQNSSEVIFDVLKRRDIRR